MIAEDYQTKKMLRPMSSPKTGSTSVRETWLRPAASILAEPAMRKAGITLKVSFAVSQQVSPVHHQS